VYDFRNKKAGNAEKTPKNIDSTGWQRLDALLHFCQTGLGDNHS
jgi:hypothetical protein